MDRLFKAQQPNLFTIQRNKCTQFVLEQVPDLLLPDLPSEQYILRLRFFLLTMATIFITSVRYFLQLFPWSISLC